MATVNDILTAVNEIGAWPDLFPLGNPDSLEKAGVWARILADVDGGLIQPALEAHARSSKWEPHPSDVLAWIGDQVDARRPRAGIVYETLRAYAKAQTYHLIAPSVNPRPEPLPAELVAVYEACGGRRALLDDNQAAGRANVRETLAWFDSAARRDFLAPGGAAAAVDAGTARALTAAGKP